MKKRCKLEKLFLSLTIFFVITTICCKVFMGAVVQSNNASIQRMKNRNESQKAVNLSMQMKINELSSLDNALEVADAYGLSYNNNNIKVIGE